MPADRRTTQRFGSARGRCERAMHAHPDHAQARLRRLAAAMVMAALANLGSHNWAPSGRRFVAFWRTRSQCRQQLRLLPSMCTLAQPGPAFSAWFWLERSKACLFGILPELIGL